MMSSRTCERSTRALPVMLLTAARIGTNRRRGDPKAGGYDYLPKPFDPDELVLAVSPRTRKRANFASQNARLRTGSRHRRPIHRGERGVEARARHG